MNSSSRTVPASTTARRRQVERIVGRLMIGQDTSVYALDGVEAIRLPDKNLLRLDKQLVIARTHHRRERLNGFKELDVGLTGRVQRDAASRFTHLAGT